MNFLLVASFVPILVLGSPVNIPATTEATIFDQTTQGAMFYELPYTIPDDVAIFEPDFDGKIGEWGAWSGFICPTDKCYPKLYRKRSCFPKKRFGGWEAFEKIEHCKEVGEPGEYDYSDQYCENSCWANWSEWECSKKCDGATRSRICKCSNNDPKPIENMSKGVCGKPCEPDEGPGCLATDDYAYNCKEEKFVPLIDLARGDFVKSYDFLENKYVCSKIAASHRHKEPIDFVKVTLNNGAHFSLTPEHMLYRKIYSAEADYSTYEKVTANALEIGDLVQIGEGREDSAFVVDLQVEKKIPISPQTLNSVIVVNNVTLPTLTIGDAKYGKGLVQLFDKFYDGITFEEVSNGEPGKRADRLFGELVVATRELVRMDNFEANEVGKIVIKIVEKFNGQYNSRKLVEGLEAAKGGSQN
jgi:hypothetical protein